MGAGTYGIQAASQRYFNKDASELTLSESAVLAAIPQNPTKFNPINHPEENIERRKVLSNMLSQDISLRVSMKRHLRTMYMTGFRRRIPRRSRLHRILISSMS